MFNKVIPIGRFGQNAEAKTALNNKEYVILNIATQESWMNDKGDYQNRTEWHRVYAWRNLSKFARTLQKGQLVTLEGTLRYREVEDEAKGLQSNSRGLDECDSVPFPIRYERCVWGGGEESPKNPAAADVKDMAELGRQWTAGSGACEGEVSSPKPVTFRVIWRSFSELFGVVCNMF